MAFPWMALAEGVSQGVNAIAQGSMNKKTRQWNEKMYGIQRQDALSDYNMQNTYNSPAQQMARYKAAGLNPNLIYGQQNDGATVRSSAVEQWHPQPPQFDATAITGGILQAQDVKVKAAQSDNLKAAIDAIQHENALRDAQTLAVLAGIPKTETETKGMQQDIGFKAGIYPTQLEAAKTNVSKTLAEIDATRAGTTKTVAETSEIQQQIARMKLDMNLSLQENDRRWLETRMNMKKGAMSIQEAVEGILRSKSTRATNQVERSKLLNEISILQSDDEIKKLDAAWSKAGITHDSNIFIRMVAAIADKLAKEQESGNWKIQVPNK